MGGGGGGGPHGGTGGFGGGGGGGLSDIADSGPGLGGTFGGNGASDVSATDDGGGGGGAGLGGAIFIRAGSLFLSNATFTDDSAGAGASGGGGATAGQGKGGALFVNSGATAVMLGTAPTFSGNSATNAGVADTDNANVFGMLSTGVAPGITGPSSTTFVVYGKGSFVVTATGTPAPTISETGALPAGVTFNSSTNTLSGTPTGTSFGVYHIAFTASNGVGVNATQNFTPTVSGIPAYATTPTDRYVAQLYLDLLGRGVDQSGMAFWAGELGNGVTAPAVVSAIEHHSGNEFQTREVEMLYQHYLHRAADASGLQAGINLLNTGGTVEQLAAILTGSTEYFQNRGSSTNQGFLKALYADALNRPIESTAENNDLALLSQTTRQQISNNVLRSQEYDTDLVRYLYQTLLRRPADSAGLNTFVQDLQSGVTDEAIVAALCGSAEYMQHDVGS